MRTLFTPWRWRRSRAVPALVAAVLVGYFLSPMPVLYVLWRFNLYRGPAGRVYTIVYRPVAYLQETFPAVDRFYDWQLETLFAMTRG